MRGAAAAAIYGGAHVVTGNPTLVVSHVMWDIWIFFLVQPTQPVPV